VTEGKLIKDAQRDRHNGEFMKGKKRRKIG